MKKYKTLLFDVDDTLLDFQKAERSALRMLFEEKGMSLTSEIEAQYKKINKSLWTAFEEGEINRDEVVNTRFSILFKEYGEEVDGILFENNYRSYLEEGNQLMEGALQFINQIQSEYDLYIVTNGISKTQDKRLRNAGLHALFQDIFVSEDTGYQKPMKEYFDYVFERIPNFVPEEGLIIGDSLSADMKGGYVAGIDTCWFNPERKLNDSGIIPTYEVHNFEELYALLKQHV
ncbi:MULTISPECIES: YjjG family noncanonical pyrimidine nucleotidase [Bacillus cereus group]|uniref:YjjG family noncanonical pyrimidine nucleotidase n=1 Tax=Bacillus cereus group TaxID=86661 RepID=UPI0022E068A0|nr:MULTISPECIES: YjjG family noncanonical pyrimidine nucleotidase [Bacillus cereus group]MDA2666316.1 YjjG family noncanonical pyrimidine nucleotidase [Bacillus cereus group sp. Bc032]MDA2677046.1 YjjG family noncanonical pyrimidine nucleotidase [Bacillus cereus group sp. Bc031]MDA2682526.1 YjjG family noncanonical pyrimidine nucleotidase [Bacillus cereus group sp. Bc029]MDA2687990.1 YjjG family noncanonical pyrimidine nucleotidase [Bacillus cereus group sp. Bc030]MDA2743492.1 YjjG family nonc